ncbi:unnamed protein product [Fraxinus pennsylvanica]|uniref:C2 domain-containing protein n=1 Tax=Fraxinus pennsylvanica TaxID=56036 RepID=A0AAD1ZYN0_9LAMI|nr:unnamed protein product [Fraxinus pennsylvanica]
MGSFDKVPGFIYNPTANPDRDAYFSGILEIHVHHARNIHNICIYDNQDVSAKFYLTYNPDETLSTRIVNGGGKNPEFNEVLIKEINQIDAVLKCEIWMLSRAKNSMDDRLLGFTLLPISSVIGQGKVTKDFSLSSTDLFHSPAGTIKLSLSLSANQNAPLDPCVNSLSDSSKTSDLLVDKKIPEEYFSIDFPDINVVNENQQMVSEYFLEGGSLHNHVIEAEESAKTECVNENLNIAEEGFLHDHKCIEAKKASWERQFWDIVLPGNIAEEGFFQICELDAITFIYFIMFQDSADPVPRIAKIDPDFSSLAKLKELNEDWLNSLSWRKSPPRSPTRWDSPPVSPVSPFAWEHESVEFTLKEEDDCHV